MALVVLELLTIQANKLAETMKKYGLIFLATGFVAFLIYYISKSFSPGSYGSAENYEFNIGESDLIAVIEKFKSQNPKYAVPEQPGLSDHWSKHWFVVYFYYPEQKQIIYTTIRGLGKDKTLFALVSVRTLSLGNWKDINKDFSPSENKAQIKLFENFILEEIKAMARE